MNIHLNVGHIFALLIAALWTGLAPFGWEWKALLWIWLVNEGGKLGG